MKTPGLVIAAAVAALFAQQAVAADKAQPKKDDKQQASAKIRCGGINECKGKGECGGASGACAGTNECKGQGWFTRTTKECKAKGGTILP